ncbi:MAG: T9SS type A sorting domain-containing protein [Flavobacteriales bacterium]|nr:T9SS type A sorting domain-containing protein [Flavobacteriales bacterium]
MRSKSTFLSYALVFAFCCFHSSSISQAGTLDPDFDSDGKVITEIGNADDFGYAMVIQPDGKILVCGYSDNGTLDDIAITRYNSDGSLDNSFDGDGIVTTTLGEDGGRAHAMAIQNDGKIVLAGYSYNGIDNDFALMRYNSDGSIDNSFDSDGYVTTGFALFSNDRAFAVTIQDDGKILVAGYFTNEVSGRDFALIRYNEDGSLDSTFSGGVVTTALALGGDEARKILLQNDGKILVIGFSFDSATRVFAVTRYNSDGSLDNTFDTDGIVTTSLSDIDDASYGGALQSDGKIVVTGYTHVDTYDFGVVRYNTDGSLDNTFDNDGFVITSVGTSTSSADTPFSLSIQNDGKIVAAGFAQNADNDFALVRYNSDGSIDNTFGINGIVTTNIGQSGSDDEIRAVLIQSDGKILAAGNTNNGTDNDFALARYINSNDVGINSNLNPALTIHSYPNPFSKQTTLQFNRSVNNVQITIQNMLGEQVEQLTNISGSEIIILGENLESGLYFIHITEDLQTIATNKIIVKN